MDNFTLGLLKMLTFYLKNARMARLSYAKNWFFSKTNLRILKFSTFLYGFHTKRSRSLAFWICEASEASVHKLTKARGCFEGSRQCILSFEKTTPLTNSKWNRFVEEIVTTEHDKIWLMFYWKFQFNNCHFETSFC